jgi:hypothetical protein
MKMSDKFDALMAEVLSQYRREIPVSKCLRLAYTLDQNFRYIPGELEFFTLKFGDGSEIELTD